MDYFRKKCVFKVISVVFKRAYDLCHMRSFYLFIIVKLLYKLFVCHKHVFPY